MIKNGFIKIYRSMIDWEWYDDLVTKSVFLHLLLTVNIDDNLWHGTLVKRGSRVSSYEILARELKLSVKQIRTAIKHLERSGEVARSKYPKYSVFALVNYDKFQAGAGKTASKGQSEGSLGASKGQQYKKVKESNKKVKEVSSPLGAKNKDKYSGGYTDF